MRRTVLGLLLVGVLGSIGILAQDPVTTPLPPPAGLLEATDLAGNPLDISVYLTNGGGLGTVSTSLHDDFRVPRLTFPNGAPGAERNWAGAQTDFGGFSVTYFDDDRTCFNDWSSFYPWAMVDPGIRALCAVLSRTAHASSRPGVIAPLTFTPSGGTPLVFHDWEVVDPNPGGCRTGNMGIRTIPDAPEYRGTGATFAEGVEMRLDGGNAAGVAAHFRAVYAPASPDVSRPLITVDSPRDCIGIPIGAVATVAFSCRDLGSGVDSCSATPGYENGATIDTSAYGSFSFDVTAVDQAGHSRTRTVRYHVVDATAPGAAPVVTTPNAAGWNNTDVTVTWNWTDNPAGVGIDPANCPATGTSTGEGDAIVVTGSCTDLGGNTGHASVTVKVDKTPPGPQADNTDRVVPNPVVQYALATVLPGIWEDGLSGMASSSCAAPDTTVVGSRSVECTGYDVAGNVLVRKATYQVTAATGEYLFWHNGGPAASTIHRIGADGTGRTSFAVSYAATSIAASAHSFLYVQPFDAFGTPCINGWNDVIMTDLNGEHPKCSGSPGQTFLRVSTSPGYVYIRNPVVTLKLFQDFGAVDGFFNGPVVFVADDTYLYYVPFDNPSVIRRSKPNGSDSIVIATLNEAVYELAISGDYLFWIDGQDRHIGRVRTDGTDLRSDMIQVNANALAAGARHVYWSNLGETTIGRAALDGTAVQKEFITDSGGWVRSMALGGSPVPDRTKPTVTITTPEGGATYLRHQTVLADYACTDEANGSGIASCQGPVEPGTAIDTSTIGPRSFTVTAIDNGGNSNSVTHTYTVGYEFTGFLDPISAPPIVNRGRAGRTYALKFQLLDLGVPITDPGVASFSYAPTSCAAMSGTTADPLEATATGNTELRVDAGTGTFVYNWKTPSVKGCYVLWLNVTTGQKFSAYFELQ